MSMNVERVITVKGELENMIRALEVIHQKIKSAFENDTKTYGAQAIMMGGIPPLPLVPPYAAAYPQNARFPGQQNGVPQAAYANFYVNFRKFRRFSSLINFFLFSFKALSSNLSFLYTRIYSTSSSTASTTKLFSCTTASSTTSSTTNTATSNNDATKCTTAATIDTIIN